MWKCYTVSTDIESQEKLCGSVPLSVKILSVTIVAMWKCYTVSNDIDSHKSSYVEVLHCQ